MHNSSSKAWKQTKGLSGAEAESAKLGTYYIVLRTLETGLFIYADGRHARVHNRVYIDILLVVATTGCGAYRVQGYELVKLVIIRYMLDVHSPNERYAGSGPI